MTSFIIQAHQDRAVHTTWQSQPDCPFCRIVHGDSAAYKVYEDDMVVAILDILPLRSGHTLVIPKAHTSRVSELPEEFAAACGIAVSKVARAIAAALQNTALNVVCNQEYAQAVPHVHYHIIPAPRPGDEVGPNTAPEHRNHVTKPLSEKEMHLREYEARIELDEDAAKSLVESIRTYL